MTLTYISVCAHLIKSLIRQIELGSICFSNTRRTSKSGEYYEYNFPEKQIDFIE